MSQPEKTPAPLRRSPLEDPQLIHEICKYLPPKSLSSHRLLNSVWSSSCLAQLETLSATTQPNPPSVLKRHGLDFDTSKVNLADVIDNARTTVKLFGPGTVHSVYVTLRRQPQPWSRKKRAQLCSQIAEIVKGTELVEMRIRVSRDSGWTFQSAVDILGVVASVRYLMLSTHWPEQVPIRFPPFVMDTVEVLELEGKTIGNCVTSLKDTHWANLKCLRLNWQAVPQRNEEGHSVWQLDGQRALNSVVKFLQNGCPAVYFCRIHVVTKDESLIRLLPGQLTSIQNLMPKVEFEVTAGDELELG